MFHENPKKEIAFTSDEIHESMLAQKKILCSN